MSAAVPSRALKNLIRFLGLAVLVGMALFPPWQMVYSLGGKQHSTDVGYRPLWDPPSEEPTVSEEATEAGYRVNVVRLGIQLAVVLAAMNVAIYCLKDPKG